jgi:UDP-N-acetylmuramoyl-tripeptide--D-alanyl-D-alanine ligase
MRAAILNFATADLPNKTLWIGGMKEMGTEEKNEHRELVELISQYQWRNVILVGKEFKDQQDVYTWFETSADAAVYIKLHPPTDSAILIKGSRGSKMEVLLEALNPSR